MKLFLDSAIVGEIDARLNTGVISGVTTNPTLIKRSGREPDDVYADLIKDIGVTDLSIEVNGFNSRDLILNGVKYADEIVNTFKDRGQLVNCVGKYTLSESKSIISKCNMIIGPDGGILQIASAFDKKIIALFAQIDCKLRFTEATDYICLYDEKAVENINPEDIANSVISEVRAKS